MTGDKLTPDRRRRIKEAVKTVPFAQLLGIEVGRIDKSSATLNLTVRHELTQIHGIVHGGVIASLIDTATAFAIIPHLAPKERITTVDLTISYLRPLSAGKVTAMAKVVRGGRRLFVVKAEVFDDAKNLAATALSTYIKV